MAKICTNCAASNPDTGRFCSECGVALAPNRVPAAPPIRGVGTPVAPPLARGESIAAADVARSIQTRMGTIASGRKADILFVLDCTRSMRGEIDAIRDAILSFAGTIESDGVRARIGLIEFRDRLIGEEARVLRFGATGEVFTRDVATFRQEVAALQAKGGGDAPESSLDAIMLALRQPFAGDATKVLVIITDAPPHIPDRETGSIDEVVSALRANGVQQCYLVMRTRDSASQVYLKLLEAAPGLAFDLGVGDDFQKRAKNFKRTLMSLGKTISSSTL